MMAPIIDEFKPVKNSKNKLRSIPRMINFKLRYIDKERYLKSIINCAYREEIIRKNRITNATSLKKSPVIGINPTINIIKRR